MLIKIIVSLSVQEILIVLLIAKIRRLLACTHVLVLTSVQMVVMDAKRLFACVMTMKATQTTLLVQSFTRMPTTFVYAGGFLYTSTKVILVNSSSVTP